MSSVQRGREGGKLRSYVCARGGRRRARPSGWALPAVRWPAPPGLQRLPARCGSRWGRPQKVAGRRRSAAPGTAAPPVGHGRHRPGSPPGALLKTGPGSGMVGHGAGVRARGCRRRGCKGFRAAPPGSLLPRASLGAFASSPCPPPNGPPLPTELGEDVQQLAGHDAAGSAEVHGPGEARARLTPESFNGSNPSPPTTSPTRCHIRPALLGNLLPAVTAWPLPGVARVEERGLQESGWEDQNVVRHGIVSAEPPRGHLPPAGTARLDTGSATRCRPRPDTRSAAPVSEPLACSPLTSAGRLGAQGLCLLCSRTCVEGKAARRCGQS